MLTLHCSSPALLDVPLIGGPPGMLVSFPAGATMVALPADGGQRHIALQELVPIGGGAYRVIARLLPAWQPCTPTNLKRLGVSISAKTMQRLIRAGFVRGSQPTPLLHEFDYYSYDAHQRASSDPEFWDRVEPGHTLTNRARHRAMRDVSAANKD